MHLKISFDKEHSFIHLSFAQFRGFFFVFFTVTKSIISVLIRRRFDTLHSVAVTFYLNVPFAVSRMWILFSLGEITKPCSMQAIRFCIKLEGKYSGLA